jgi:beta-glucanase (GH16 family)
MRRRHTLAFGVPIVAAMVLWGPGLPGGSHSSGARASAATVAARSAQVSLRSAAEAVAPPSGKPEFNATFSGSHLNTNIWDTCYPSMSQSGCTNYGNKEYEWYMPSQVKVSGGHLRLIAQRTPVEGKARNGKTNKRYYCRSGMVTSYPGFKFKYGFVQVLADVPHAAGLWPALWLLSANGSFPPEIDMIESWGVNHETAAFFHPVGARYSKGSIPLSLTQGWQTYSLRWTSSKLTYYVGGTVVLTVTQRVPHKPMYLLANVAEYVRPANGNCSGQMLIKSVKVWKG